MIPFEIALSEPSEGLLFTVHLSEPSFFAMYVVEPPPSRFIAYLQPASNMM